MKRKWRLVAIVCLSVCAGVGASVWVMYLRSGAPYNPTRQTVAILYAAKNEALSNVWNFRVISEASASRWSVWTRLRQSSMAPLNVAKSG